MRKLLFYGKRMDNGEWVEGWYVHTKRHHCIIAGCIDDGYVVYGHYASDVAMYVVDPATVGQYTGKTDKKKVKIFENHIVSFEWFNSTHTGKVVFNEKTCGFEIWFNTVVGAYGEKATHKINFSNIDNIEVIGNIHDNPDLLRE